MMRTAPDNRSQGMGRRNIANLNPRLANRWGANEAQGRRGMALQQDALRDWRQGGRQGARPELENAVRYSMNMSGMDGGRNAARRAWRGGAYRNYTGGGIGGLVGREQNQQEAPQSQWRRDADPESLTPLMRLHHERGNLNNLVGRDRYAQLIGAPYGRREGQYTPPGAYGGMNPDDLPSWAEYYQLLQDPRYRDSGQGM